METKNQLLPDNLQKYVDTLPSSEKNTKTELFEIMSNRSWNEQLIAENYEKLSFRERLEFQLDEFIRGLHMYWKSEYTKQLQLISDASSMLLITIDNHETSDSEEKWIYYTYVTHKLLEIMKKFHPDLDIVINWYRWLPQEKYEDIKIAFLRALWQMFPMAEIGNKNIPMTLLRANSQFKTILSMFTSRFPSYDINLN
jgi:hypothetical protein